MSDPTEKVIWRDSALLFGALLLLNAAVLWLGSRLL